MQCFHAFDGEEVGCDAADFRSHAVEQAAELLQVRFAGSVVDGGSAFGKYGGHHYIGGSGDGCFVEQHIVTAKLVGGDFVDSTFLVVAEIRAQGLNADKVSVQATTTDFVSTRFGYQCFAEACNHRPD